MASDNSSRFGSVDESGLLDLVLNKDAQCTKKATEQSWRIFLAYCAEKNIEIEVATADKKELDIVFKVLC